MEKINLANHKKLLNYLGKGKLAACLAPLCGYAELLFAILIPRQMAKIIDQGVLLADSKAIMQQGLYLLAMSFASLFFGLLASLTSAYSGSQLTANLRTALFKQILNFSFPNYDKFSSASLVTRLTNDLSVIQFSFITNLRLLTKMPFMLILALLMTYNINRQIALTYFTLLPLMICILIFIEVKAYPLFSRLFVAMDDLNNNVKENVTGIRVVKAFVREDTEYDKFASTVENLYQINYKAEKLVNYWNPLVLSIIYAAVLLVIYLGGRSLVFGSMQIGELTSIMIYTMQVVWSFFSFAFIFMVNLHSEAARTRTMEVLDTQISLLSPKDGLKAVKDASVEFKQVAFSYDEEQAKLVLKDVNFKLASGQSMGIIGATGSGKSSLVQLLPRLYDVCEGQVLVGGHDARDYDLSCLRQAISIVLQRNILFKGTISENLRFAKANASVEELREVCKIACADEFIKDLDKQYDYELLKGASNLSGGQKQRLCIARALLKEPKLLILDDSLSAVDGKTASKIQFNLRKLRAYMSTIVISERIKPLLDCDYVLILQAGRVNAFDTPTNLLKSNQIFQDLYELETVNKEDANGQA